LRQPVEFSRQAAGDETDVTAFARLFEGDGGGNLFRSR
jgi:hypothetical protein